MPARAGISGWEICFWYSYGEGAFMWAIHFISKRFAFYPFNISAPIFLPERAYFLCDKNPAK